MKEMERLPGFEIVMSRQMEYQGRRERVCLVRKGKNYGTLVDVLNGFLIYAPCYREKGILPARRTLDGIYAVIQWTTRTKGLARYVALLLERGQLGISSVNLENGSANVLALPVLKQIDRRHPC